MIDLDTGETAGPFAFHGSSTLRSYLEGCPVRRPAGQSSCVWGKFLNSTKQHLNPVVTANKTGSFIAQASFCCQPDRTALSRTLAVFTHTHTDAHTRTKHEYTNMGNAIPQELTMEATGPKLRPSKSMAVFRKLGRQLCMSLYAFVCVCVCVFCVCASAVIT